MSSFWTRFTVDGGDGLLIVSVKRYCGLYSIQKELRLGISKENVEGNL